MNVTSWKLFDLIQSHVKHLILIVNIQTNDNFFEEKEAKTIISHKIFDPEAAAYYKQCIAPRESSIFNVIDLAPFTRDILKKALID